MLQVRGIERVNKMSELSGNQKMGRERGKGRDKRKVRKKEKREREGRGKEKS